MLDPERVGASLREYYATASDQEILDDLRQASPELAKRLGVMEDPPAVRRARRRPNGGLRGWFASFGQSVHRLFS